MSRENSHLGTIKGRLLHLVEMFESGIPAQLARNAGIPQSTFHNYIKGRLPSIEHLIHIHNTYRIDLTWLLTGKGEMFVGGKEADLDTPERPEFKISDALAMAARVLESGTTYATALYLNIQHFDRAVQAENRMTHLETGMEALLSKISHLEQRISELAADND